MKKKISGVIPPLVTTYDQNGNFDHERMKNLVKFVEKGGVNGVFVCGTYGSGPLMGLKEREDVLETVINSVSSSTVVIAAFGEPLIGFYHVKEKGKSNPYFRMTIGGDTSNVVLQLAKLGYSAKYITKLCKDHFGENILRKWKEWNVDCSNAVIDSVGQRKSVSFNIHPSISNLTFLLQREGVS